MSGSVSVCACVFVIACLHVSAPLPFSLSLDYTFVYVLLRVRFRGVLFLSTLSPFPLSLLNVWHCWKPFCHVLPMPVTGLTLNEP